MVGKDYRKEVCRMFYRNMALRSTFIGMITAVCLFGLLCGGREKDVYITLWMSVALLILHVAFFFRKEMADSRLSNLYPKVGFYEQRTAVREHLDYLAAEIKTAQDSGLSFETVQIMRKGFGKIFTNAKILGYVEKDETWDAFFKNDKK